MNAESATLLPTPLRILLVLNFRWDARLGVVRVYMDLADEWRAAGHVVEYYSLSDAFPGEVDSSAGFAMRQVLFASKAKAFIKKNAARFDVIDAHIGALSASKEELKFNGLLVARSVGLYLLYERFEKSAHQRWPRRSRGKFLGRILYTLTRRWLLRASDLAVRHADLINVPNEGEANYLLREIGTTRPVIVKPYGLTDERCRTLRDAASPPLARLAHRKISFVGMWGARKGAHDWSHIIRRIRQRIPDARFSFLGTMVDAPAILRDLALESPDGIELISDYSPAALPRLLSDCAVGIFPSYVEGFGLAVLEQLTAGIPTIAYDTSGPRDILSATLPEMIVPVGDIEAVASAVCRILTLDLVAYEKLFERSAEVVKQFSWSGIAQETIEIYRERLRAIQAGPVLFVQPFSLGSAGGGARILRALLGQAPLEWHSICSSPERPKAWPNETHIRSRPSWGKIERSRLAMLPRMTMSIFVSGFRRRLRAFCSKRNVRAIHAIPHSGLDFYDAHWVATTLRLPFFLHVHDDFAYSSRGYVSPPRANVAMQSAWCGAEARFVISDRLGEEYRRRYGARDFITVTDGLENVAPAPVVRPPNELRIYFMGLFHLEYEENLRSLCEACERVGRLRPSLRVSITMRCGALRSEVMRAAHGTIHVRPFGTEADVHRDLDQADLLYLPLPFGQRFEPLVRFSFSTKLITYLGSGLPILYHGPQTSAVYEMLFQYAAALFSSSLDVEAMAETLCQVCAEPDTVAKVSANALTLARSRFMLEDQRARFWNVLAQTLVDSRQNENTTA